MNYFEFVVDPLSPYLQNGVVPGVEITLPESTAFERDECTPGEIYKISDTDLIQCSDPLEAFQDYEIDPPYRFFQAREFESEPEGCLDFMAYVGPFAGKAEPEPPA